MTEKTGIALRAFKVAIGQERSRVFAKDAEVTFPKNQFDDFAALGLVGPKPKSKKRAKQPETELPIPGNDTAQSGTT